jgi:hypothetical protein
MEIKNLLTRILRWLVVKKWAYMVILPRGASKAVLPGKGNSAPYSGSISNFSLRAFRSSAVIILVTDFILDLDEDAIKRREELGNL